MFWNFGKFSQYNTPMNTTLRHFWSQFPAVYRSLPELGGDAVTVVTAEHPGLVVVETQQQGDCLVFTAPVITKESPDPGEEFSTDWRSEIRIKAFIAILMRDQHIAH